jgi:histidinol-phosphate aminotransferase
MFGARVAALDYERGPAGPVLSSERIIAHLREVKPRLFCLPNPDSPTGTVIPPDQLRAIVETCAALGAMVLIDEAYHPFYDKSCVSWTAQYPNLIVARTFAKAWGLAGLRLGYAIGHPDTIRYFHKMRPMYEASTVAIAFVEKMLDFPHEMEASVARLVAGKKYFLDQMQVLGYDVLRGEGNFLHVAFGAHAEQVHRTLRDRVLYRADFKEACLSGYSRFSATTVEKFMPVVELIRAAANPGANS